MSGAQQRKLALLPALSRLAHLRAIEQANYDAGAQRVARLTRLVLVALDHSSQPAPRPPAFLGLRTDAAYELARLQSESALTFCHELGIPTP